MDPQLQPVGFKKGITMRLLNITEARQRAWKEMLDPDKKRKTYSRRDIFAYFIYRYLIITMGEKTSKLIGCDWSEVFTHCNESPLRTLRKCRVIVNWRKKSAQIVPKTAKFDIDNPDLIWACLDRVYVQFAQAMMNDFSSKPKHQPFSSYMKYQATN